MDKEHAMRLITRSLLGEKVESESLQAAIEAISNSRTHLQELQLMIGEKANLLSEIENEILCSDVSEMLDELVEMDMTEIETVYPDAWKHLSGCEECRHAFEIIFSTIVEHLPTSIPSRPFSEVHLTPRWELKDIIKRENEPIFHVVRGWLKNLPFSETSTETQQVVFSFIDPPEIDERGRLRMTLDFSKSELENQQIRIELRDELYALTLCEVPFQAERLVICDLSPFSLDPMSLPTQAVVATPIYQERFVERLGELRDSHLSVVDFVDGFSEALTHFGEPLEQLLKQEIEADKNKAQLESIIGYAKTQLESYTQAWEMCNGAPPKEREHTNVLTNAYKKLQEPKGPETALSRRQAAPEPEVKIQNENTTRTPQSQQGTQLTIHPRRPKVRSEEDI